MGVIGTVPAGTFKAVVLGIGHRVLCVAVRFTERKQQESMPKDVGKMLLHASLQIGALVCRGDMCGRQLEQGIAICQR